MLSRFELIKTPREREQRDQAEYAVWKIRGDEQPANSARESGSDGLQPEFRGYLLR